LKKGSSPVILLFKDRTINSVFGIIRKTPAAEETALEKVTKSQLEVFFSTLMTFSIH